MALARAVTPQRAVRLIPLCRRRQALLYGVSLNVPSCNGLRGALGEVCLPSRPPPRSRSLSSCTNTSYSAFFKHKKIGKNSHISLPSPPSYTAETGKALVCPFVLNRVTGLQATRPPPRTQLAGLRMFAETRTPRRCPHARPRQPPVRGLPPGFAWCGRPRYTWSPVLGVRHLAAHPQVHPCCRVCWGLVPFYGQMTFHCADGHFVGFGLPCVARAEPRHVATPYV